MASPVSQQIKNLKGGISQQPENLRYPNQATAQVNCWSSEAEGLQKRAPTVFVKRLGLHSPAHSESFFHFVNRDLQERYIMMFCGSNIRIFGLDGTEYTVNGASEHPYITTDKPRDDIRVITVADYTFVVNRNMVITEDTTKTHPDYIGFNKRALINVRGGQYGRTLTVKVNDVVLATVVLPVGDKPEHVKATDAEDIVGKIVAAINTDHGTAYSATGSGGHVAITALGEGVIDKVETSDGYAATLINGLVYEISNVNKLPITAPDGYIVKVTGEVTSTGDAYWVRYDTKRNMWRETVAPDVNKGVNNDTMPHALVRGADGTFTFRPLSWTPRLAGDEDTNPHPSFLEGKINDVFYFRNRLGFLSGENVIMSRSGEYFDFYPASIAVLKDDDPIDIAVSHNQISILKYAVPFSEQLLLWAEESQFVLKATSSTLTNRTVDLELTTEFNVSDFARPYGIDRGVYFVSPRASFSTIKRYYMITDASDVKTAEDISAHVPNYLPNRVVHMHGSGTENFLLCVSDHPSSRSKVFIYKYLYMDEQIVQQAWSHWDFGEDSEVLTAYCIGSYMWVLMNRGGNLTIERVEFTKDTTDMAIEPYRAHIDMKLVVAAGVYNQDDNETVFTYTAMYGFVPPKGVYAYLRQDGSFVRIEHDGVQTFFTINGEVEESAIFGRIYDMFYTFSKFLPKAQAEDGSVITDDLGRLQLSRAWVNYFDTGSFEITVDNGSHVYSYPTGGGRIGDGTATIGALVKSSDTMRFPVTGNAVRQTVCVVSENPTPVSLVGCGWEGRLVKRVQSI